MEIDTIPTLPLPPSPFFCRVVAAVLMKRKLLKRKFSRVVTVAVAAGIGICVGKLKKLARWM